jgi:hypothetical protein
MKPDYKYLHLYSLFSSSDKTNAIGKRGVSHFPMKHQFSLQQHAGTVSATYKMANPREKVHCCF